MKNNVIIVVLVLSLSNGLQAKNITTTQTAGLTVAQGPLKGITLKDRNVELLNVSLVDHPEAIFRIKRSQKAVNTLLKDISSVKKAAKTEQQAFITKQLENVLSPVKDFFDEIQKFSGMVLPILTESMTNHNKANNSMLIKYFSSQTNIQDFCKQNITSIALLESIGQELACFFEDLNATFSPQVKTAFKKWFMEMKKKAKK